MSRYARLQRPLGLWPRLQREAWLRETAPATSLFGPGAAAAELSPSTLRLRVEALGHWFGHLERQDRLPVECALHLVTPETLDGFVIEQRARGVGDTTLAIRLGSLHAAFRLIAPTHDFSFIVRPGGMPLSRVLKKTSREVSLRSVEELLVLVRQLYEQGLEHVGYAGGRTCIRDAALLGVLATVAPRIRSLAEMEHGQHVQKRDGFYTLRFEASNMKQRRRHSPALPELLTPILDTYIHRVRPAFGGDHTTKFWVGMAGALSARGLAEIVRRRTQNAFGQARGPHWFRTCITTSSSLESSKAIFDVCCILDHSLQVSLDHYNKAEATAAIKRHEIRVRRRAELCRGLATRFFAEQTPAILSALSAKRAPSI